MIIRTQERDGKAIFYTLSLSVKEIEVWATKSGACWPCSQLRGHRLFVAVDQVGIYDYQIDGTSICVSSSGELEACIGDHLPGYCKHLWPTWSIE